MPLTETEINAGIDFHTGRITFISLHTGAPGTTGANEVTGGDYARVATSWAAASGGFADDSNLSFDVPANISVLHVGGWSASSGGTFRGYGTLEEQIDVPVGGDRIIVVDLARLITPIA